MSALSQLLLARFWQNFKGSFLGASRTDSNNQVDICPGNICPGNICPYQEYLSCYWPDFNETLNLNQYWQAEVEKVVDPVIQNDRKYFLNIEKHVIFKTPTQPQLNLTLI